MNDVSHDMINVIKENLIKTKWEKVMGPLCYDNGSQPDNNYKKNLF